MGHRDGVAPRRKILIVDDHPIVRQGMAQLINYQDDLVLCCETEDAAGALEAMRTCSHDLAIVDISLPGASGLDLVRNLISRYPTLPILVVSMYAECSYAVRAVRAGAKGYVTKQEATQTILSAIREILNGSAYLSPAMNAEVVKRITHSSADECSFWIDKLSNRECEVLRLIGMGFSTIQVANQLKRSVKTIESHRANIKAKLGMESSSQLVTLASRWVAGEIDRVR